MKRFFNGLKWVLASVAFALTYVEVVELWWHLPRYIPECISVFLGCIVFVAIAPARRGWVAGAVASLMLFLLTSVVMALMGSSVYDSLVVALARFLRHCSLAGTLGFIVSGAIGGHVGCKLKGIIKPKMNGTSDPLG